MEMSNPLLLLGLRMNLGEIALLTSKLGVEQIESSLGILKLISLIEFKC